MSGDRVIEYTPSATLSKFHASNALVRGIRGPFGSGKSVGCCWELWTRALEQRANKDGIRKSRGLVTRNTYGELTSTTIKTWLDWFPEERFGKMVHGAPIVQMCRWEAEDGTKVELEMMFLALDRPEHVKKLLSLDITFGWMNEAREQPKAILDALTGRVGRYPRAEDGGATWSGVIMDTNSPDDDHWWYDLAETNCPPEFKFFSQPAGDSEEAENLDWLLQTPETMKLPCGHPQRRARGHMYYERLKAGKTSEWIKVYVKGQYGTVHDGKPVYPEWNDSLHTKEIYPVQGVKLVIGVDFGLTPAAVITQSDARGRLLVLDEICAEDMGFRQFLEDALIPYLITNYPAWWNKKDDMIILIGDPAGDQRAQSDEKSCFQEARAKKLKIRAAKSNNWLPRRGAVAWFLSKLASGQPMFLLDTACGVLRKGFNGGYKYRRIKVTGEERFTDEPAKNKYSHCFVAGTMVATPHGERGIETLTVGDLVLTPDGPREVLATMSRLVDATVALEFSHGRQAECTGDHPFFVGGNQVRADELQYSDVLQTIGENEWEDRPNTRRKISTALATIASRVATSSRTMVFTSIERFGFSTMGRSLQATTFIMPTMTKVTMSSAIWSALPRLNMPATMDENGFPRGQKRRGFTWRSFDLLHRLGMAPMQESSGTKTTVSARGKTGKAKTCGAPTAEALSRLWSALRSAGSALLRVNQRREGQAASTTSIACAASAATGSRSTSTQGQRRAVHLVRRSSLVGQKEVFDLTIQDAHCFYAAGVLVSNCHDALQYAAMESGGIQAIQQAGRQQPRIAPFQPSVPGMGVL